MMYDPAVLHTVRIFIHMDCRQQTTRHTVECQGCSLVARQQVCSGVREEGQRQQGAPVPECQTLQGFSISKPSSLIHLLVPVTGTIPSYEQFEESCLGKIIKIQERSSTKEGSEAAWLIFTASTLRYQVPLITHTWAKCQILTLSSV